MEDTTNIKTLEKALKVLDALRESGSSIGVNELAKRCEVSPATTFRILKTLKSDGWAYQDDCDKYSPGWKLSYSSSSEQSFRRLLRELAYYTMAELSAVEHEAMNLAVRDMDKCYILCQSHTGKMVDYVPPVGTVLPSHASACSKILLSELPELVLARILDRTAFTKMTEATITDRSAFIDELSVVRQQGYALDNHESQAEGFCIAVPVRSPGGEIVAALSFSGFIGRRTVNEIDHYLALLNNASEQIRRDVFSDNQSLLEQS